MSNNKQSSVEWYINNLIEILGDEIINKLTIEQTNQIHSLGNKAVAMHKEEMDKVAGDFWNEGASYVYNGQRKYNSFEQYYNETFGGNE